MVRRDLSVCGERNWDSEDRDAHKVTSLLSSDMILEPNSL